MISAIIRGGRSAYAHTQGQVWSAYCPCPSGRPGVQSHGRVGRCLFIIVVSMPGCADWARLLRYLRAVREIWGELEGEIFPAQERGRRHWAFTDNECDVAILALYEATFSSLFSHLCRQCAVLGLGT